ncbi:MAG: nucleotide exchange factor GrpE [Defluviitaleaceae bacterium]|nr:nucleotide exchange factor GrpE [Defluviitaleaceae bacterium]
MIDNIKIAFKMVIDYSNSVKEKLKNYEKEHKIIKAISETLTLKLENLEHIDIESAEKELLEEIITFNEILNYSIEGLKNTEFEDILMYIQMAEEANSLINTTLHSFDIKKIAPEKGERFNSREHAVIMAEKQPNMEKGEIIKTASNGYKKGNKILIKANVIASK